MSDTNGHAGPDPLTLPRLLFVRSRAAVLGLADGDVIEPPYPLPEYSGLVVVRVVEAAFLDRLVYPPEQAPPPVERVAGAHHIGTGA